MTLMDSFIRITTFTVKVAAVVLVAPHGSVNTARYRFVFWVLSAVNVRLEALAPGMLVKGPLFTLTCHCAAGVGMPLAAAVKVTLCPLITVWLAGFMVIRGAVSTVSVAALVLAD